MSIETKTDSFVYGSSMHGGRPTFALTRRLGEDAGLTLYELIPRDLADGRQRRFQKSNNNRNLTQLSLTDAIPDIRVDSNGNFQFEDIASPVERSPADWEWDDWCGLKIATLRDSRQQAIQPLVRDVLMESGMNLDAVTRGEGSAIFSEGDGVRLTIAFLAMKRLQKYEKLTEVADSISKMSLEECYYWHAKCRSPSNQSGIRALRILLAGHIN